MTKKANKRPGKGKNTKKVARAKAAGPAMPVALKGYLQMLADPCGAALTRAPYTGTDSGYLIRTRCTFTPTAGTATGSVNSYMIQWTPAGAAKNGFVQVTTGDATFSTLAKDDFLTSGTVAKARPLASCLKWVPTGPVTSRQGVVGMSYSTGGLVTNGGSTSGITFDDLLNGCNMLASNGSVPHEVKWLPTIADQTFTNPLVSVASEVSGGCVTIVLSKVDCTAGVPNGYIEATTIYEWTPAVDQGAAPSVAKPMPYTTQDALAYITDMGQFLFGDSMAAIGAAARRVAGEMVTTMLTGATHMAGRRGGFMSL